MLWGEHRPTQGSSQSLSEDLVTPHILRDELVWGPRLGVGEAVKAEGKWEPSFGSSGWVSMGEKAGPALTSP